MITIHHIIIETGFTIEFQGFSDGFSMPISLMSGPMGFGRLKHSAFAVHFGDRLGPGVAVELWEIDHRTR